MQRHELNEDEGESFGAELLDSSDDFPLERLFDPRPFNAAEQARWAAFTCGGK